MEQLREFMLLFRMQPSDRQPFMVIRAVSLAEAAALARGCPVLLAGGSVEVRNIVPLQA